MGNHYRQGKLIDFVNVQGYAMGTWILSVSLVLWCNNVMIKYTVGLLKQLLCFVNTEVKCQETQDWRNMKLMKHAQEEKTTR